MRGYVYYAAGQECSFKEEEPQGAAEKFGEAMKLKLNLKMNLAVLGLEFFLLGLGLLFVYAHNIDNAWNMMRWSYFDGKDYTQFVDCGATGCYGADSMYMQGFRGMLYGAGLMIIGFCFMFAHSMNLVDRRDKTC